MVSGAQARFFFFLFRVLYVSRLGSLTDHRHSGGAGSCKPLEYSPIGADVIATFHPRLRSVRLRFIKLPPTLSSVLRRRSLNPRFAILSRNQLVVPNAKIQCYFAIRPIFSQRSLSWRPQSVPFLLFPSFPPQTLLSLTDSSYFPDPF